MKLKGIHLFDKYTKEYLTTLSFHEEATLDNFNEAVEQYAKRNVRSKESIVWFPAEEAV